MNTPARSDRLRHAVAQAAEKAAHSARLVSERSGPPAPGDLYLIADNSESPVEWLVLRAHSAIPGLVFVVPVDESPWQGTLDWQVDPQSVGRRLFVRSGMGLWVSSAYLRDEHRVGALPHENLPQIVQKAAQAAASSALASAEDGRDDADPEYQDWVRLVGEARDRLQQQVDEGGVLVRFSDALSQSPRTRVGGPPIVPTAVFGTHRRLPLHAALHDAADRLRYPDSRFQTLGHLILMLEDAGVCALWDTSAGPAPSLAVRNDAGEFQPVVWQPSPEGRLQRAEPIFVWIDGRVVLAVGGDPSGPAHTILVQQ